jgi:hypothetical protein
MTPRTGGEVIIEALKLYWFGGQPEAALKIIGIVTDWREDQALVATAGQDGAI